ncbi:MAG: glycine-rich domain-containing protein [Endozoicomonas sp.]|uniref:glycine-rich domain-containing protein n=1 Tax=Endozoicomonas sp. TaxID=1892382 RepID=UPI003D9BD0DC
MIDTQPDHNVSINYDQLVVLEPNTKMDYKIINPLETLEEKWTYINSSINWTWLYESLTVEEKNAAFQPLVDCETADEIFKQYKRYLYMLCKYDDIYFSPTIAMDIAWHAHILDSQAYFRDCHALFGRYQHHFPYFGARGEGDRSNLLEAFENTRKIYQFEFDEILD